MFKRCEDSGLFTIDPRSHVAVENFRRMFKFVGRLMGIAIYGRHVIDMPLCSFVWKRFLGQSPVLEDLKDADPIYAQSLQWVLDNDITGVVDETFSVQRDEFGDLIVVDLVPHGRNIPVTNENKGSYVSSIVDYVTGGAIQDQLRAMLLGFHEIVPKDTLANFKVSDLRELLNGRRKVDVEDLKNCVRYTGGLRPFSKVVVYFWRVLASFTDETRMDLLRFVTGTNKIPLDGFDPTLTITGTDAGDDSLPTAHTCFNQLVLPRYKSADRLKDKLLKAIKHGVSEGFHLT